MLAGEAGIGDHVALLVGGGLVFTVLMSFLVSAVCGYMAGLIGSSNSPLSGVGYLVVIGAALPLLLLGSLSRDMFNRNRNRMLGAGKWLKGVFGAILVAIGLLILTGIDKQLEARLVEMSPAWLTALTTQF